MWCEDYIVMFLLTQNWLAIAVSDLVLNILCAKTSHSLHFPPVKALQGRGYLCHRTLFCCLSRSDIHCSASANKNRYNQYLNLGMVACFFCFWDHFTNLAGNSYKKIIILPLKSTYWIISHQWLEIIFSIRQFQWMWLSWDNHTPGVQPCL